MDFCGNENPVKDEPSAFYDVCEKEEPDYSECSWRSSCGLDIEPRFDQSTTFDRKDIVGDTKDRYDYEISPCGSNFKNHDSNDELKGKRETDDSTYYVDSHDVQNFSDSDCVDVKQFDEVVGESCLGFKELLADSDDVSKLDKDFFHCHHCDFSTKFRGNLVRHIKFKHLPTQLLECSLCSIKFRFRCDLRRHIALHDDYDLEPCRFKCFFCKFKTEKKFNISRHLFNNHAFNTPQGVFDQLRKCYFCSYGTDVKLDLLNHLIDDHKLGFIDKNPLFPCGLCSYYTYCKSLLIQHIDGYHKKIRPYACHICDYAANRPVDLRIHISAKHEKITPYKCEMCSYASAYKKHLGRHILSQHVKKKQKTNYVRKVKVKPS